MNERQRNILNLLSTKFETSVNKLADVMKVSYVTIRHDLNSLESDGFLGRVHGGTVLRNEDDICFRLGINYDNKLKIAKMASSYIKEGDTIFVESGSVNALLDRELTNIGKINIITSNVFIVQQVAQKSTPFYYSLQPSLPFIYYPTKFYTNFLKTPTKILHYPSGRGTLHSSNFERRVRQAMSLIWPLAARQSLKKEQLFGKPGAILGWVGFDQSLN